MTRKSTLLCVFESKPKKIRLHPNRVTKIILLVPWQNCIIQGVQYLTSQAKCNMLSLHNFFSFSTSKSKHQKKEPVLRSELNFRTYLPVYICQFLFLFFVLPVIIFSPSRWQMGSLFPTVFPSLQQITHLAHHHGGEVYVFTQLTLGLVL